MTVILTAVLTGFARRQTFLKLSTPGGFRKNRIFKQYRIFSIKRRGRLFKTRPRIPGVYWNPAFIY